MVIITVDLLSPISEQISLCCAPRCNLLTISNLFLFENGLRFFFKQQRYSFSPELF
jgi:hypothetical protein